MTLQNLPDYYMAFGLGPMEIGVVVIIVLILFGPKRLPGLGKSIGEAIKSFKKGISDEEEVDVTDSVKKSKEKEKIKDKEEE